MSYFPGTLNYYQNPLISYFSEFHSEYYPSTQYQRSRIERSARQPSFCITIPARIKICKAIQERLHSQQVAKYGKGINEYVGKTQIVYYMPTQPQSQWYAIGGAQKDFKAFLDNYRHVYDIDKATNLIVSNNYRTINQWLQANGSKKLIKPFTPRDLGAALFFDLDLKWKVPAEKSVIASQYSSFDVTNGFDILSSKYYLLPVIQIQTIVPEITVFIEMLSGAPNTTEDDPYYFNPKDPYRIPEKIIDTRRNRQFFRSDKHLYLGVRIPEIMAILNENVDHMKNFKFRTFDYTYSLADIVMQTRINMNANGFKSKTSMRNEARNVCEPFGELSKPMLVVDRPFLLWVSHEFVRYPLFVAYFNTDAWVNVT